MSVTEDLIKRAQAGDSSASEQLVVENSGLIWSIAKRFFGRGTEPDDLYQLGAVGFLKAVEGFDTGFGTQFSTYAVPKIAGEIRRYLRDNGTIKVSRSLKEQAGAIKAARQKLTGQLDREPTLSELSEATGLSCEEIATAETANAQTQSISAAKTDDGFSLEMILSDGTMETDIVEKIALREAIGQLSERENTVIKLRYFHGLTQERVARIIGVSQVQVSRIEKKALERLRTFLKEI